MSSFVAHSMHLLRRLLHAPRDAPHAGVDVVLDGLTAVAVTEAALADTAALGAAWPASAAGRAWDRHRTRQPRNHVGEMLASIETAGSRGALAAAIGATLSGQRATTFLSGPDLLAAPDLLALAAGQHAPLVIHLATRAPAGHAQTLGSGHEAYHAAADQGCFQLFAINVQEAVDLAVIARHVAERALVPGLVAMDGEQTALALQDVLLPGEPLIRAFLGAPHDPIETPTAAQRFIFGDTRRRVPRFHDLERPLMLGPLQTPGTWGRGVAGRRPYFDDHLPALLAAGFAAFAEATGRRYDPVFAHHADRADIVLVAQGAAVETLAAVADAAPGKVGVLGVRSLRPFPGGAIAAALRGVKTVAVLERMDAPHGEGPLIREVRAALDRARENARFGPDTHPGTPAIADRDLPRLVSVPFGCGGVPLRAADVLALAGELETPRRSRICLGVDLARTASGYPRQEALVDALRRSHPNLDALGLRSDDPAPDVRPDDAVTIAVHRVTGAGHETLAADIADLLHAAFGGHVRSRPALTWSRFDEPCVDVVVHAPGPLRDPGDDVPVDIVVKPPASGPEIEALLGGLLARVARQRGVTLTRSAVRAARAGALADLDETERETRLDALADAAESAGDAETSPTEPAPARDVSPPDSVRRADAGPDTLHALPRFWNQVGVFARAEQEERIAGDPCLATGAMPPLSSTFRAVGDTGDVLPVFDPLACDGHPALWTSDPDGAVAPLVISARALLDAGLELASAAGHPADPLRAIAAKLARAANTVMREGSPPPITAGALLDAAFVTVAAGMDESRRAPLHAALDAVIEGVGELPVARTAVFFDEPEQQKPGSGELFTLVVNPDACRSPQIVVAAGAGHGITATPRTGESVAAARRQWGLWHRLPDTSGATIERVRTHPEVGPLAALMLSRHCLHAMAPGDGAEAGSGARLALARVLAVAESHEQPRAGRLLAEIESLRTRLGERIRDTLAGALPTGDLDALAHGLQVLGRDEVDLAALSSRIDTAVSGGRVDGAVLGRLVDVARGLADLEWHLAQGAGGLGRARFGLAIAPGAVATWAGVFPYNPFQGPVLVGAQPETGAAALGLLEGQLRQTLAGLRLLRAARLVLDPSGDTAGALAQLAELGLEDLDRDERELIPPMLLVGDDRGLGGAALGELMAALSGELPLKVVVLADIGGAADGGLAVDAFDGYPVGIRHDLPLLAMSARRAFVAQTSIAFPDHFAESVRDALAHDGPAMIVVHAPSPRRHGFEVARLHEQAALAVASRAHTLLRFDPAAGGVFGSCLDLVGNPAVAARLATDESGGAALTPVDWAVTETRYAEHFAPLAGAGAPTPIAEFLALPDDRRAGCEPFVVVRRGDATERLQVSPALVADADRRLRVWRTLQELAGVVTPFTAEVREAAEHDVAAHHRAEIESLRAEHEARLADLRRVMHAETAQRLTERLMAMAGRGATVPGSPRNGEDPS